MSEGRPTPLHCSPAGVRAFRDRGQQGTGGRAFATRRNSTVISNSHLQTGLTSVILITLGTVKLQFQGPFVPNCGQFSELWELMS